MPWTLFTKTSQQGETYETHLAKHFPLSAAHFSIPLTACGSAGTATVAPVTAAPAAEPVNPHVILATTTSTQDSGLLDILVPLFQEQTGYTVQTIAVETGEVLAIIGSNGAGRSTLFLVLARLLKADQGQIFFFHYT